MNDEAAARAPRPISATRARRDGPRWPSRARASCVSVVVLGQLTVACSAAYLGVDGGRDDAGDPPLPTVSDASSRTEPARDADLPTVDASTRAADARADAADAALDARASADAADANGSDFHARNER